MFYSAFCTAAFKFDNPLSVDMQNMKTGCILSPPLLMFGFRQKPKSISFFEVSLQRQSAIKSCPHRWVKHFMGFY